MANGDWTPWFTATTQTQATFSGTQGVAYTFRVRATDNVNNTSAWVQAEAKMVVVKKYYSVADQRVAMRENGVLYYLHTDHLGSASLTTDASGTIHAQQRYFPYGETRWSSTPLPTDRQFTGQRREAALGIYDYKARFYSPRLSRFLSADTIVPGAADSAGGGAATLGYSDQVRLTPLTVGFHETQFLDILNSENRELLQYGPPALWSDEVRREHIVPMGPINPQALNRYAYCLNNPLQYVDPTGHITIKLSKYELITIRNGIREWKKTFSRLSTWTVWPGVTLTIIGGLATSGGLLVGPFAFVPGVGLDILAGIFSMMSSDLEDIEDYLSDMIDEMGDEDAIELTIEPAKDFWDKMYGYGYLVSFENANKHLIISFPVILLLMNEILETKGELDDKKNDH